jgi:nicotinamidase-related amidase
MVTSCLFIIDVQQGFINEWTRHIPERVSALQGLYDEVVVSRFVNPEGSPFRMIMGWTRFAPGSEDVALAFAPRPDALVIDKARYTCLGAETAALLADADIERVDLCGIATDNCILKTAVDLFEAGVMPIVHADYCASHGGPDCHRAGLLLLRRFIGADQVVAGDAGLPPG